MTVTNLFSSKNRMRNHRTAVRRFRERNDPMAIYNREERIRENNWRHETPENAKVVELGDGQMSICHVDFDPSWSEPIAIVRVRNTDEELEFGTKAKNLREIATLFLQVAGELEQFNDQLAKQHPEFFEEPK